MSNKKEDKELQRLEQLHRDKMERLERFFLSRKKGKSGADVPVPDQPRDSGTSKVQLSRLKLSQKIGLLLWLDRKGFLTSGGEKNLIYLQSKASFEALESSIRFLRRLEDEVKLPFDFQHEIRALNRRFRTSPERKYRRDRIRGYRDKGTAPDVSLSARRRASEEAFLSVDSFLSLSPVQVLIELVPESIVDGEWVDLDYLRNLDFEERLDIAQLLV